MFNPRSKSRKFWVGPEILGYYKVDEYGSGTPLVEHFSLDLNIQWPIFGRTQPCAEYRNFATAENYDHAARLPGTLPALGPGGVGHGRTSRPCNPVSATASTGSGKRDRIAGIAILLPPHAASCASPPPAELPPLALGGVGHE
eukprot:scaffold41094_cov36-Phaeocystis_antarctica.AAC.1